MTSPDEDLFGRAFLISTAGAHVDESAGKPISAEKGSVALPRHDLNSLDERPLACDSFLYACIDVGRGRGDDGGSCSFPSVTAAVPSCTYVFLPALSSSSSSPTPAQAENPGEKEVQALRSNRNASRGRPSSDMISFPRPAYIAPLVSPWSLNISSLAFSQPSKPSGDMCSSSTIISPPKEAWSCAWEASSGCDKTLPPTNDHVQEHNRRRKKRGKKSRRSRSETDDIPDNGPCQPLTTSSAAAVNNASFRQVASPRLDDGSRSPTDVSAHSWLKCSEGACGAVGLFEADRRSLTLLYMISDSLGEEPSHVAQEQHAR